MSFRMSGVLLCVPAVTFAARPTLWDTRSLAVAEDAWCSQEAPSKDGSSSFQSSSSTFLGDFGVPFSCFFPPSESTGRASIGKGIGGLEQLVQGTQAEQDEAGHLSS